MGALNLHVFGDDHKIGLLTHEAREQTFSVEYDP